MAIAKISVWKKKKTKQKIEHVAFFKKNFMVPFYG